MAIMGERAFIVTESAFPMPLGFPSEMIASPSRRLRFCIIWRIFHCGMQARLPDRAQNAKSESRDQDDGILGAKWIWHALGRARVIAPSPIHDEAVGVESRRQRNCGAPQATDIHQVHGVLVPIREVGSQLDGTGCRSIQNKLHCLRVSRLVRRPASTAPCRLFGRSVLRCSFG